MTTSDVLRQGRDDLAKCEKAVDTWSDTAESARLEADQLEAEAGRTVLADPESLGTVQARIAELRQQAGIADLAVIAAEDQVQGARRDILESAAGHMSKRAEALRARADDEDGQIAKVVQKLRDMTGDEYGPIATLRDTSGNVVRQQVGVSRPDRLRAEAKEHDTFAAELRQAAQQPTIGETELEKMLRRADPDGPEARAAAERIAEAERERAERMESQQADRRARTEWIEQRARQIDAGGRWTGDHARARAEAEIREAVREHGSVDAAIAALEARGADDPAVVDA